LKNETNTIKKGAAPPAQIGEEGEIMAVLYGYEVYPDITVTRTLSLAVFLVDDYTDRQPLGWVNVVLTANGRDLKSIKNPGNYFLFFDLPDSGTGYHIRVEADYYFDMDEPVTPSALDPLSPVVQLRLKPKPSYPFSAGVTLIRGVFQDTDGNPVPGARVDVLERNISTITTQKGEFAFYFKGLFEEDLFEEGGQWFVKGKPGKILHLEVVKDSSTWTYKWDIGAVEGMTTALKEPITLSKKKMNKIDKIGGKNGRKSGSKIKRFKG
jgi:hypothetical protein